MDAHINNRETFLTDAQFLNRLSKRVRLRFVVEINGDLQRSKLVTRWSFFFHLFSLFPSFLSPFLSLLSARFFFLFFLLARNGSRIHVFYQFDFLHCTKSPAFHHRAARDFTSREMSFSLFTRFFFFFFARQAAQLRDTKRRTQPFCFPNRPFAFFSIRFRRASRRSLWRETCASSPIRFYRNGFEIFIDIKSIENITPLKINPFCPIFINLY